MTTTASTKPRRPQRPTIVGTDGRRDADTKRGVRVSKATSAIVPQARAFYFFFVYFFFAKDCVCLLYDVSFLDVKKELIISSDSSK
jgi:hypothetical protein